MQVGVRCPGTTVIALIPAQGGGVLCALAPGFNTITVGQATTASAFLAQNETYAVEVAVPRPAADASLAGLDIFHHSVGGAFSPYAVELYTAVRTTTAPLRCLLAHTSELFLHGPGSGRAEPLRADINSPPFLELTAVRLA